MTGSGNHTAKLVQTRYQFAAYIMSQTLLQQKKKTREKVLIVIIDCRGKTDRQRRKGTNWKVTAVNHIILYLFHCKAEHSVISGFLVQFSLTLLTGCCSYGENPIQGYCPVCLLFMIVSFLKHTHTREQTLSKPVAQHPNMCIKEEGQAMPLKRRKTCSTHTRRHL